MPTQDDSALQAVRRRHEVRVLESLMRHGGRSRRELEADTKLSRTTLSAIIGDLRARGVLLEGEPASPQANRNGRPTKVLSLNPRAGAAVGIELGRQRLSLSVVGFDGATITADHRPMDPSLPLPARVALAATAVRELIDSGAIVPESIIGTGVGIASRHANPLSLSDAQEQQSEPEGASLAPLREVLPAPLLWDNNIRLAALAHLHEDADLLYVVLSAGISAASVSNGVLLRGGHGIAGELGHLSVDFTGPPCWCGRTGCLESFLGEAPVLAEAARRGQAFASITELAAAAADHHDVALAVVGWAGELLARALVSACVLLDPRRVVIAGELAQLGDALLTPTRAALAAQQLGLGARDIELSTAAFTPTAGSAGAAGLALRHWATTTLD